MYVQRSCCVAVFGSCLYSTCLQGLWWRMTTIWLFLTWMWHICSRWCDAGMPLACELGHVALHKCCRRTQLNEVGSVRYYWRGNPIEWRGNPTGCKRNSIEWWGNSTKWERNPTERGNPTQWREYPTREWWYHGNCTYALRCMLRWPWQLQRWCEDGRRK